MRMDMYNSVTYVAFNVGVISSAAVIILISLLILYFFISRDSTNNICKKCIGASMWNIITVSVFCGVFFFVGHDLDFSDYILSDYTLSDISITVFGTSMFLFYLAIGVIFTAIIKALCRFLYKIFRKIRM